MVINVNKEIPAKVVLPINGYLIKVPTNFNNGLKKVIRHRQTTIIIVVCLWRITGNTLAYLWITRFISHGLQGGKE